MNYFAHAHRFLVAGNRDAWFLAGLAVPDWLSVSRRRVKCRSRDAEAFVDDDDPRLAALARGIVQHHADDQWFHGTRAFTELSLSLAVRIHRSLGDQSDLRPGFLGHVLLELLLDDVLIQQDRRMLDDYYVAIDEVDPQWVADAVGQMCGQSVPVLSSFIPKFVDMRFLADYGDDVRLCYRLSQVLDRVGLGPLPATFATLLPEARDEVRQHAARLLEPAGAPEREL